MELTAFHYVIDALALIMLIWNTVEVGRNDAANIVNAVFGGGGDDSKEGRLARGYCRCGGSHG